MGGMMRNLARRECMAGVAVVGLLGGCKVVTKGGKAAAADPLAKQLAGMADQLLAEYPENATILGIAKGPHEPLAHRLTDRSAAGREALASAARARLQRLKALDLKDLGVPAKLDAAVALAAHEITDEGYRFPYGDVVNLDPNIGYRNTP